MTHVDQPDAVLFRAHEDRPDVPAVQREEVADARTLERERDQLSGVTGVHYCAIAHGMAGVLNAACGAPSRGIRITPPCACIA